MYSWTLITGDNAVTSDARSFRQSLGTFPTGVCLVTTIDEQGKREGMTINSFVSVSLDPPLVLWSIRNDARSSEAFIAGKCFIICVLASSQQALAEHFARPASDKFQDYASHFEDGIGRCPRLRNSVATFECTNYSRHAEGDHTILLGRVERHLRSDAAPLILHMGKAGSIREMAEEFSKTGVAQ